ncbi:MAG: hypothetical protein WCT26_04685 [Candidatus Buchananbacteria bacterium]|jgi:hypothetical protein
MEGTKKDKWEPINFIFYLSFVKWPVLLAVAVEIGLRLLMANWLPDLSLDRVDLFMWVVRLIAFIYVGWRIGKVYGEVPPMGAIAGAISGLAIGLIISIFRFISGFHTWKIFNIITESTLAVLVGGLAVFLVVYIWDMLPEAIKNYQFKIKK